MPSRTMASLYACRSFEYQQRNIRALKELFEHIIIVTLKRQYFSYPYNRTKSQYYEPIRRRLAPGYGS